MNTLIKPVLEQINQVILGKEHQAKLAVACLLSDGHLLIDDIPGVGKTTLSHALAKTFGLTYKRVQFTSDLLPSDILGISVFDRSSQSFRFHEGAIFTEVLLADEINRASAKTQSALLEAMEERQVTIDGETRTLPDPFLVIATQNPLEHKGTNPLPESQIDRFTIRIVLGYPQPESERQLWKGDNGKKQLDNVKPVIHDTDLKNLRLEVASVFVSDALLDYLAAIVQHTRTSRFYTRGLSPRAALNLLHVTRAWAVIHGRDYATPDDMQTVLPYVAAHRLQTLKPEDSFEEIEYNLQHIEIP